VRRLLLRPVAGESAVQRLEACRGSCLAEQLLRTTIHRKHGHLFSVNCCWLLSVHVVASLTGRLVSRNVELIFLILRSVLRRGDLLFLSSNRYKTFTLALDLK
jgi:hypothetical protein